MCNYARCMWQLAPTSLQEVANYCCENVALTYGWHAVTIQRANFSLHDVGLKRLSTPSSRVSMRRPRRRHIVDLSVDLSPDRTTVSSSKILLQIEPSVGYRLPEDRHQKASARPPVPGRPSKRGLSVCVYLRPIQCLLTFKRNWAPLSLFTVPPTWPASFGSPPKPAGHVGSVLLRVCLPAFSLILKLTWFCSLEEYMP
jgi:hypothetical protein